MHKSHPKKKTSWEPVEKWYRGIVGEEGHYFHQNVIFPNLLRLLNLSDYKETSLLDLGCGQGVLAAHLPSEIPYMGIDLSPSLIKAAKAHDQNPNHEYRVADVTKSLKLERSFSHAVLLLALQNMEHPLVVFKNAKEHLRPGGQLLIVLNHPCFRIPRQSSWQVDHEKKIQYRRIDRYAKPMAIPIAAHPSKGAQSPATISYHYPLSSYVGWLREAGFAIATIEEWCSDKKSTGAAAKMENRSREEFPLFLTILAFSH